MLCLLGRHRFPFAAPATIWLVCAALSFFDGRLIVNNDGVFVAGMAAAVLLGNLRHGFQARAGLAIVLGGAAVVVYNDPGHEDGDLLFTPVLFALGWLVGYALRERAEQTEAAEERAARAEQEREAAARVAVAEERGRIARELHDVVAHAVSVMVLQVGAVRHRMSETDQEDREALTNVEQAGRTALAEMRRLLDAMRQDGDELELLPHPGLADLDALIDEVRAAGLPVRLQVHGEPYRAATGPRPLGVPHPARGPHQHAQARPRTAGRGGRSLRRHRDPAGGSRRRRRTLPERGRRRPRARAGRHLRARQDLRRPDVGRPREHRRVRPACAPAPGPRSLMSIRVLVVDDQSMVRAGFRLLLADEPDIEVVAEAGTGLEAVAQAARFHPNVILMDIRMPELDGLEATRRILAADPAARILVLTTFNLDDYVYEALRAGASGFVLKDDPPEQLIAAVRTIAGGEALLSPAITKRVIQHFTRLHRQAPPKAVDSLTARELEVFRLITRGLSNAEIGQELFISDTTVKTHVTRLLQKLDLRDRAQAIVLAYQTGLFDAPGPPGPT